MSARVDVDALRALALEAMRRAYAPYSGFPVGAAALADDGRIVAGCNVESASYGLTICAERVAVFAAIAAGERSINTVAVVTETDQPTAPCGACRQVLREFGTDIQITSATLSGRRHDTTLAELLPGAFGPDNLTA